MTENDLAEKVRQYGSFLDESVGKISVIIERERQMNPNTRGREADARRLQEVYGQETAYLTALREFKEKFPDFYQAKPKTE